MMVCVSTDRVIANSDTSAIEGTVHWAPVRSLWAAAMTLSALLLGPLYVTRWSVSIFLITTALTLCFGHSLGLHRLLIHRSFVANRWLEYVLVYLGTLVGMAGPLEMIKIHDMRDWAQRQAECHPLHAHRASFLRDNWWQMHCRLELRHPPIFALEKPVASDRFLRAIDQTWMAQQLPLGLLLFALGGWPWVIWGICVRVAVSLNGHWLVGHLTHRGHLQTWAVDGVAVQGYDLPVAALISFGEAWHGNHHAWPGSARFGLEQGQYDPGWLVLLGLQHVGLVKNLKQPSDLCPREGLRRIVGVAVPP